ncbi:hypothetical protein T02_9512 [Trichinella nativa]|uniref:Uncharacterized protein n=1 Tax=Trichinella nativa TaxID=6335 RepID=A0A0V1KNS2_9BILA|nr:hypothetical protein T02_9512 [Trichinella nativa]
MVKLIKWRICSCNSDIYDSKRAMTKVVVLQLLIIAQNRADCTEWNFLQRYQLIAMIVTETLIGCGVGQFSVDKFVLYCIEQRQLCSGASGMLIEKKCKEKIRLIGQPVEKKGNNIQTAVGRCSGQLSHDPVLSWSCELSITPSRSIRQILRCDN